MNFNKVTDKLNKNVNEETTLINSISIGKYLLIYIPVLFFMFAVAQFIAYLLFGFEFDWRAILIQAISFAVLFRIFHTVRKKINEQWTNKHS